MLKVSRLTVNNRVVANFGSSTEEVSIKEIYENNFASVLLDSGEKRLISGDNLSEIPITLAQFGRLSFIQSKLDSELITQVYPESGNQDVFFTITAKESKNNTWEVTIKNSEYEILGVGRIKTLNGYQNFFKQFTDGLEAHIN